jgi:hypothetical protein
VAGLAVVAVAVVAVILLTGDDDDGGSGGAGSVRTIELGGPTDDAPAAPKFKLSIPPTWDEVPKEQLTDARGEPLVVLRRENRTGLLVVTRQSSAKDLDLETLGKRLGKEVKSGVADAREVASRPTRLPAGDAYVYSFVRRKAGTAHTIVVVPSGPSTYVLNTVIPSGEKQAAQESGEIVRSLRFE